MGKYMIVVLKSEYKNDLFIQLLNEELSNRFGSNTSIKFNTWSYLQEEADYINTHPEGLKQLTHWERPITKEQLHKNFFWLRMGEFHFKLSACPSSDEARDAVAVCKWLMHTKGKYIDKKECSNYSPKIVKEYTNHLFEEARYNMTALWQLPKHNNKNSGKQLKR